MLLCLLTLLLGCGSTEVIEKPVVVEVEVVKWREVPPNLLIIHNKSTVPDILKYGELIQLWAEDRAIIEKQNGQLKAIESLSQ